MVKHIKALTSLRGVAAILIVIHHYVGCVIPNFDKSIALYSKFFFNGYLCVDFFFILSGFILTHIYANNFVTKVSIHNYRQFLYSRFTRIYPLHIFMILLFLGVEFLKLGFFLFKSKSIFDPTNQSFLPFTDTQKIVALFNNIFMIQVLDLKSPQLFGDNTSWNEPTWSISAEWIAYLLLPLLLFFLVKLPRIYDLVIYLTLLMCLFLLIKFTYGHLNFLGIPAISRCTLEAIIGIITYKVYYIGNFRKYLGHNFTVFLSLLCIFFIMHYDYQDILIVAAFSILILSVSINTKNNSIILNALKYSLVIYLGTIKFVELRMQHYLKTTRFAKKYIFYGN
ncbi:acyltransferase family protein [Nostoc sp. KVJ3]|uniref:acyltransferase family protein n=1 Tax=Nostoc sp. KVJ3 TaxID=457945 RepID=UPI0022389E10|nr:acyltransferase [Nostoc sp. KVJ3]MCW5313988.1 acyltransferase family protein [Nostoc sp. KVJ3]